MSEYPIIGQKGYNPNSGYSRDGHGWETVYKENRYIEQDNLLDLYTHAYSNIRLIARAATKIQPKYVRISNPEIEVERHWMIDSFNSKKRRTSPRELWESIYCYSMVSDNTYLQWHYTTATKRGFPFAVDVLLPSSIEHDYDKTEKTFKGYVMLHGRGKRTNLKDKEITHIADWSPLNKLGGFSPVRALSKYLSIEQFIAMYQVGFFQNSALPSGAFIIEANEADFRNIVEDVKRKHMGPGKNHAVQFIRKDPRKDQMMKFEKFQQDNSSLDLQTLYDRIDKKMDEAFGIPKELKGSIDSTNLAGVNIAERIFTKQVVVPKVESVFDRINGWICRQFPDEDIMLAFDDPMPENLEADKQEADIMKVAAETASILRASGATVETIREVTGIEDLEFEQPIQVETRSANLEVKQEAETKSANSSAGNKLLSVSQLNDETNDIQNVFHAHLDKQLSRVIQLLNQKQIDDIDRLDAEAESSELRALLLPALLLVLEKAGRQHRTEILRQLDLSQIEISAELITPSLRRAVAGQVTGLSTSFTQDTLLDLRSIVSEAGRLGLTRQQLERDLRNYYTTDGEYITEGGKIIKNNARYRAERTARTETNRANNRASLEQMQAIQRDTGETFEKVWRRRGTRPEPVCDALEGRVVGLSEPFIKTGEVITEVNERAVTHNYFDADVPPQHPNCVLPDTVIESDSFTHLTKFNYSGDVYSIETSSGRVVEVTPNHLILTTKGFIPAKMVVKGDKVVTNGVDAVNRLVESNPDTDDKPSSISQLYDSISGAFPMATSSMPIAAKDFKGDGARGKGNVDIIDINSLLGSDSYATVLQLLDKNILKKTSLGGGLDTLGTPQQLFTALASASDGSVSLGSQSFTISETGVAIPDSLLFTATPEYDARLAKFVGDSASRPTSDIANMQDTFAGIIAFDEVNSVSVRNYSGHVYDSSTLSTLYTANGVVTSNCLCYLEYRRIRN